MNLSLRFIYKAISTNEIYLYFFHLLIHFVINIKNSKIKKILVFSVQMKSQRLNMFLNILPFLILMLISQTTCEEMSAANVSCALCLIGATEIEAMTDIGFDEELLIGLLIQVRILRKKSMLHWSWLFSITYDIFSLLSFQKCTDIFDESLSKMGSIFLETCINFSYYFVIDVIDLIDQGLTPETVCTTMEACSNGDKFLQETYYAIDDILGEESIILISSWWLSRQASQKNEKQ